MNVLYVVQTPLHLLVATSLLYNNNNEVPFFQIEGELILKYSDSIRAIANQLGGDLVGTCSGGGLKNSMKYFRRIFIKRVIPNRKQSRNIYDKVVVFSPSMNCVEIRQAYPNADFVLAEDGSGTYSGLIMSRKAYLDKHKNSNNSSSKLLKLIFGNTLFLNFSQVMVFRPDCVTYDYGIPILPITIQDEAIELYRKMIGDTETQMSLANRAVFMGNFNPEIGLKDDEIIELNELFRIMPNALYRAHPRSSEKYEIDKMHVSKSWEVSCKTANENTILVSMGSSGLTTPKMIYDTEPFLIFTYKLHRNMIPGFYSSFELSSERAKKLYTNKNKVYAPDTIEDYIDIIREIVDISIDN